MGVDIVTVQYYALGLIVCHGKWIVDPITTTQKDPHKIHQQDRHQIFEVDLSWAMHLVRFGSSHYGKLDRKVEEVTKGL